MGKGKNPYLLFIKSNLVQNCKGKKYKEHQEKCSKEGRQGTQQQTNKRQHRDFNIQGMEGQCTRRGNLNSDDNK